MEHLLLTMKCALTSVACPKEAVGSILRKVREVKMRITVIHRRRDEIRLRGGHFFRSLVRYNLRERFPEVTFEGCAGLIRVLGQ